MLHRLHSPVLKVVFGAAYALVAAEFYLRFVAPVPLLPRYVIATSYGVRANQPNLVYYHTTPECYVRMQTNSKGIRTDREIPYEKPAGVKRIVALGDSFGMGYEVNQDEMFLSRLEESLRRAGVPCEVVNLSVSGHGNSEELLALRAEGFKYEPDLVLVCWHSSDVIDNIRSALLKLEGGKLVRSQPEYLPGTAIQQKLASYSLYRWLSEHCQLYSFVREEVAGKLKGLLLLLRSSGTEKSSRDTAGSKAPAPTPSPAREGPAPSLADDARLSIALLKEIGRESAEHDAQFLVLDIPEGVLFNSEGALDNSEIRSVFPQDPGGKDFGLRVVRPAERFQRVPDDQLLFRKHGHHHLTPLGCQIVGEQLAETILRDHLLDTPPRTRALAGGVRTDHPRPTASAPAARRLDPPRLPASDLHAQAVDSTR